MITAEYTPNPRLAILASELELLNSELLDEGFDDRVRIATLRHAARHMLRMSQLFVNRPVENNDEVEFDFA